MKGVFGSRAVLISVAIVVVLQALFTYAPFMQALFNTTPLDPEIWGHIAGASVVLFLLVEVEKAIFRSPARGPAPRTAPVPQAQRATAVVAPGDWIRPVLAGLLGLLLVVASGAFYLHTRSSLTREEAPIARAPAVRTIVVNGVIAPVSQTPISASVAGVIATLSCDVGARVEKGEACATLDPRSFDEALARERTALAAAERRLSQRQSAEARAQAKLQRLDARSGRRSVGRKTLANARRALSRRQAQVERAEAQVSLRRETVAKAEAARAGAELRTPSAGIILERRAAVGARVDAGAPLFVIADAKTVRLRAKAAGEGAPDIAPGAKALLTSAAAPDRTFVGRVVETRRPAPPQEDATADIVIEAENPELALRPGMEASARIEIEAREADSR
jgi:RND family efflux transporter MFP subunit